VAGTVKKERLSRSTQLCTVPRQHSILDYVLHTQTLRGICQVENQSPTRDVSDTDRRMGMLEVRGVQGQDLRAAQGPTALFSLATAA
jgi:hypothetical protein